MSAPRSSPFGLLGGGRGVRRRDGCAPPPVAASDQPDACAHCGLPLGRTPIIVTVAGERAGFCCTGCVLVLQVTRARGDQGAASALLVRLGLALFFTLTGMLGASASEGPL